MISDTAWKSCKRVLCIYKSRRSSDLKRMQSVLSEDVDRKLRQQTTEYSSKQTPEKNINRTTTCPWCLQLSNWDRIHSVRVRHGCSSVKLLWATAALRVKCLQRTEMAGCWCLEGVIFVLLSLFSVSTITLYWYNWGRLEYYWFQKYKTCYDLIINLQSEWNEKLTSHQNVSSKFDHVPKFSCYETEFPSTEASGWG